ncbi:MAG: translation elongation factor Ts [Acetobacteraceae bacterium]
MVEIRAVQAKELRDKTGAGIMDCKRALAESGGEIEAAVDWLRKKGLAAAAKRAGRASTEGLVGIVSSLSGTPQRAAMVEVNTETDFVARNQTFQAFVAAVAAVALETGEDRDAILGAPFPGAAGRSVGEELGQLAATVGENITLRRARVLAAPVVASYVHAALRPGLGRIGVLVGLSGRGEPAAILELGRQVGMQVAAACPEAIDIAGVDPAALEREKAVLAEQAHASGKPEDIIARMVEGRIRKYYEEVVLLEQVWVHDGESRVKAVLNKAGIVLTGFARFALGEGDASSPSTQSAEAAA